MKKIVFYVLFFLFFAFSIGQSAENTYCTTADEAAKEEERRSILLNPNGSFRILINKGQCSDSGLCVLYESFGPCGTIKQQVDRNNDGKCDQVLEWESIVDPEYGVFF